jgi:hypothetical protein
MLNGVTQCDETPFFYAHFSSDRPTDRVMCVKKERKMKKLLVTSISAVALLGLAACSDSGTDSTTTQSTSPDTTTTAPAPDTGATGGAAGTMGTDTGGAGGGAATGGAE